MGVKNVAKTILEDDRKLYLVVFISVVSFLAVSSVSVLNVLVNKELTLNLEALQIQVDKHQEDIRLLRNLLNINDNNNRMKRSLHCHNNSAAEDTTEDHVTESVSPDIFKAEKFASNSTVKKHLHHKHKTHHRHRGMHHQHKNADIEKATSIDQDFNTLSQSTTQEGSVTQTPLPLISNRSQTPSDLKYITKRSMYERYSSTSQEFSPYTNEGVVLEPASRETRSRLYVPSKNSRKKSLTCIHLSGDTSRYQLGVHENFRGNGHLRHLSSRFVDWVPSNWVQRTGMDTHFSYSDGYLTIKETGIYFVYAQVHYYDEHDENAFRVYKNGQVLLQCTAAAHSAIKTLKGTSCYTAAAEYMNENDKIHLEDIGRDRYSVFEKGKSFFGAIKL